MRAETPALLRLRLRAHGYHPIPCEGKRPPLEAWTAKFDTNEAEIRLWDRVWHLATNTGMLTKFMPVGDIDITDEPAAEGVEALARAHFEERGHFLVRIGLAPKRAFLLRTDEPFSKLVRYFTAPNGGEHKIEILGDGQQVIAFGIHPDTQQPYRWHGGSPADVTREQLPYARRDDLVRFLDAAEKLLVEDYGFTLVRGLAEADGEARAAGEPLAKSSRVAAAVAVIPNNDLGWDDWNRIGMAIWAATNGSAHGFEIFDHWSRKSRKYDARATSKKWTSYVRSPPTRIGFGTLKYLADQADPAWEDSLRGEPPEPDPDDPGAQPATQGPAKAPVFDPWEHFIVPAFPFEILPDIIQNYVNAQSTVIGCDPSAFAMAVLATFSGALHHGFALKMMRNGDWYERPRLWMLLVGNPSTRKTPIFNIATKPLVHYETHLRVKYEADMRDYELALAEHKGDAAAKPHKPDLPLRYVVWDTTVEKLGEILARSDKGLLVKSDEISGWIANMERYNNARSDRGFWLCAYDGGPHNIDRIKRGEIFIKNLSVSLLGGIQPMRLTELQGLTSDGLLQRFIPVMMRSGSLPQDQPSDDRTYRAHVREMIFAKPAHLIMTDDALVIMNELRQRLHELEEDTAAIGLQTFAGKLHGLAGSLALILHMAREPRLGATLPVDAHTVENTRRVVEDFILPHAFEFYRTDETASPGERLRHLASWILTSGATRLLASDLTRNVRAFRGLSLFEVNQRVSPLVAAGWLEPADRTPVCRSWTVSPQIHAQHAERAKIEKARKSRLRTKIMRDATARSVPRIST